jgi:hypothetical protein
MRDLNLFLIYNIGLLNMVVCWNGQWDHPPSHLTHIVSIYFALLKACDPYDLFTLDYWGWGALYYSVKDGYLHLQFLPLPQCSNTWKQVWHIDGLPKINIFY